MIASRTTAVCKTGTTLFRFVLLLACAIAQADGSTVVYDLGLTTGTGGFSLTAVFDDEVPGAIRGTVTLTPGPNTGDIVAVYINLNSSLALPPLPPFAQIRDAIEGVHITSRAINTSNIQSGDIGAKYSIGLAIGKDGIGSGKGDIQALSFLIKTPELTLQHLGAMAVRVTSVGNPFGSREQSGKFADAYGTYIPDDSSGVPEPGTYLSAGLGLCALCWYRRRSARR